MTPLVSAPAAVGAIVSTAGLCGLRGDFGTQIPRKASTSQAGPVEIIDALTTF